MIRIEQLLNAAYLGVDGGDHREIDLEYWFVTVHPFQVWKENV